MLLAVAGTAALVMVVVTSVKKARRAAALRVVAPHPPLRLPRRRPRAAAPAVDRHRLPVAPRPRPCSGGACMPCAPAPCSSSGSGCRCGARCSAPLRVARRAGRGPRRHDRDRRRPGRAPDAGARRPVLPVALPRRPGLEPRQPLLDLRRPRRPRPCGSPRPTSATGRRAAGHAAARHPGPRRGPLRPAARRGPRPPQGAAHGFRHRHHPDARAARGARPGPRRRHRRAPGAVAARGRARRRDRRARRAPAAPATCSSRAPACPGRDSWLPAQARHLTDVAGAARDRARRRRPRRLPLRLRRLDDRRPHRRASTPASRPTPCTSSASPTDPRPDAPKEPAMRRITLWLLSTISTLVLLFSYHTSTSSAAATSIVAQSGHRHRPAPRPPATDPRRPAPAPPGSGIRRRAASPPPGQRLLVGRQRLVVLGRQDLHRRRRSTRFGDVQVQITVKNGKITASHGHPGAVEQRPRPGDQLLRRADPQPGGRRRAEREHRHGLGRDVHLATATSSRCSPRSTRRNL